MGLFSKKEQKNKRIMPDQSESKIYIKSVTRVEPAVYTRLGEDGADVPSDILLKTVERLSRDESVYNDETLPAIADFLVSHNYVYKIEENNITTRYDVVNLKNAEDLLETIRRTVEAVKNINTCVYTCPICGVPHFISASDYKVIMNVTAGKSIEIDFSFEYIPKHQDILSEEIIEAKKFENLHRMQPMKYSFNMTEKDAVIMIADYIYKYTGIKKDSILVNGKRFNEYLELIQLNRSNSKKTDITLGKSKTETINSIRLEAEHLQRTKDELLTEMKIAVRYGNYDKANRIQNRMIPELEERIRQNDLLLLNALIQKHGSSRFQ